MTREELNSILEKSLTQASKSIQKCNNISDVNKSIDALTKDKIFQMDIETLNKIKSYNCLNSNEINWLQSFVSMEEELKMLLKDKYDKLNIVESIIEKLTQYKEKNKSTIDVIILQKKLDDTKKLMSKITNNDINLIEEEDINLLVKIFIDINLSIEKQLEALKLINEMNITIYANYNMNSNEKNEEIDIDKLKETNINEELLDNLFRKYNIDWLSQYNDASASKIEEITDYKKSLLKYGDLDKIEKLLEYLNDKKLFFVFKLPEVLTKTLLTSSPEEIEELITIIEQNNQDYIEFIQNEPALLFPAIKVKTKSKSSSNKKDNSKVSSSTIGGLNHFKGIVEFLKKNDFDVETVMKDCPTLFVMNSKSISKAYDRLKMYGFDLKYSDGSTRKGFTVLKIGNMIMDNIDIGIENECYDYYKDTLTKIVDFRLNPYKVKYAKSCGIPNEQIFKGIVDRRGDGIKYCMIDSFKKNSQFGNTPSDTFSLYQAIEVPVENKELYDEIISNSDNDNISEYVLENSYISKLDELYKETELIYNFNGVVISRIKVLRYFQTLLTNMNIDNYKDALIYVISINSMLNEEEYNNINLCVSKINEKGLK